KMRPPNFFAIVVLVMLSTGLLGVSAKSNDNQTPPAPRLSSGDAFVPATGGIRDEIADAYKERYQQWKSEFLSTEIGQAQCEWYARHPHLVLTITGNREKEFVAGSGKYKWNASGELIAATVTLGARIDEGFPSSVYYPVRNALEPYQKNRLISGNVLAATKIAHEFGHVMKIGTIAEPLYHLH